MNQLRGPRPSIDPTAQLLNNPLNATNTNAFNIAPQPFNPQNNQMLQQLVNDLEKSKHTLPTLNFDGIPNQLSETQLESLITAILTPQKGTTTSVPQQTKSYFPALPPIAPNPTMSTFPFMTPMEYQTAYLQQSLHQQQKQQLSLMKSNANLMPLSPALSSSTPTLSTLPNIRPKVSSEPTLGYPLNPFEGIPLKERPFPPSFWQEPKAMKGNKVEVSHQEQSLSAKEASNDNDDIKTALKDMLGEAGLSSFEHLLSSCHPETISRLEDSPYATTTEFLNAFSDSPNPMSALILEKHSNSSANDCSESANDANKEKIEQVDRLSEFDPNQWLKHFYHTQSTIPDTNIGQLMDEGTPLDPSMTSHEMNQLFSGFFTTDEASCSSDSVMEGTLSNHGNKMLLDDYFNFDSSAFSDVMSELSQPDYPQCL